MKTTKSFLAILAASALALSACSGESKDNKTADASKPAASTSSSAPAKEGKDVETGNYPDFKACLVSDAGGWDDKSFNQSAKEGLDLAIEKLHVAHQTAESKDSADFEPNVEAMVTEGCNLIIGVGFSLGDAITKAAEANPDIKFALVDSVPGKDLPNARALVFNTAEASYLAGYAAAAATKTGILGVFTGISMPTTNIFVDGFADGVERYNKDHGKDVKVLGWDKKTQKGIAAGTFDDLTKGTQIAQQLLGQGADIIMPVAGPVGHGAASAIKAHGNAYLIGVDSDWYVSSPESKDITFTSVIKEIGAAVYDTILQAAKGEFTNKPYIGDLKNGGVSIAPFRDLAKLLPEGTEKELETIKQEIIDGKTKVETPNAPH